MTLKRWTVLDWQCDFCETGEQINASSIPNGFSEFPSEWHRLFLGTNRTTDFTADEYHFCSIKCLLRWSEKQGRFLL